MELKELFDLHEKLEARINSYWTYWSIAVFAIGGWIFSKSGGLNAAQARPISVGITVFFLCNLGVLWQATQLVLGVRDEIRLKANEKRFASSHLQSVLATDGLKFRLHITVFLHLMVDAVVAWTLWHVPA